MPIDLSHSVYSILFLQPKETKIETETKKWGGAETNIYKCRGGFRTGGGQGKAEIAVKGLLKVVLVRAQKEKSTAVVKSSIFLEIQK